MESVCCCALQIFFAEPGGTALETKLVVAALNVIKVARANLGEKIWGLLGGNLTSGQRNTLLVAMGEPLAPMPSPSPPTSPTGPYFLCNLDVEDSDISWPYLIADSVSRSPDSWLHHY